MSLDEPGFAGACLARSCARCGVAPSDGVALRANLGGTEGICEMRKDFCRRCFEGVRRLIESMTRSDSANDGEIARTR